MDFIEQWFGISPDGGSGSTELLCIVAVLLITAMVVWRIWPRLSHHFPRRHKSPVHGTDGPGDVERQALPDRSRARRASRRAGASGNGGALAAPRRVRREPA